MKKPHDTLPDTELEVMDAVWSLPNPVSTGQIKRELDKQRPWNLSALQTLLNRLIERGFVSAEKRDNKRYFSALIKHDEYRTRANRSFLERVNGNSVKSFVASLYDGNALSDADLKELESFISEKLNASKDK